MSGDGNKKVQDEYMQEPRNLQGRWSIQLTKPIVISRDNRITIEPDILKIIRRFNGCMIYEVKNKKYILCEYIIGGFPFLIVFHINSRKKRETVYESIGLPDNIKQNIMAASAEFIQNIKIPENTPPFQADITELISKHINQEDLEVTNAFIKVGTQGDVSTTSCTVCDNCDCFGPSTIKGVSILL